MPRSMKGLARLKFNTARRERKAPSAKADGAFSVFGTGELRNRGTGEVIALIVETVTADRMADLRRARDAVRDADLVELRLDGVADVEVAGALAGRARPVVVTCRPRWEGGRFDGDEATRLRLLAEAI